MARSYLRFAALGDSTTVGLGDATAEGWRGWARILAQALGTGYDVSLCNLAVSGATVAEVRAEQLAEGVAHAPDLASLIVGINDTMRSSWSPEQFAEDLHACASALAARGACLLTARFHDHGEVFGLPKWLIGPMTRRIEIVNAVYDEVVAEYGGLRVDLAAHPGVRRREFWSVDRLHPSELGHRALARGFADELLGIGWSFEPPALEPSGGRTVTWRDEVAWLVGEGGPWLGRRARDLGPWAVRQALTEVRRDGAGRRTPRGVDRRATGETRGPDVVAAP